MQNELELKLTIKHHEQLVASYKDMLNMVYRDKSNCFADEIGAKYKFLLRCCKNEHEECLKIARDNMRRLRESLYPARFYYNL